MNYEQIREIVSFIKNKITIEPNIAIVLGSGLSPIAEKIEEAKIISYKDIPHFPISTVKGHKGNIIVGRLQGKNIICMQGRFHYYEGYSMDEVTLPIRVFQVMGIKNLIVTNAAGGVNPSFHPGDIMLITDHINRMPNPLIGKNDDRFGTRFPNMSEAYDKNLQKIALDAAKQENISLQQGVYAANTGPNFETGAEYRMYRLLGVSAVGMSTVPEVIVAVHGGMKVLGISVISNVYNENNIEQQSHEEVLDNTVKSEDKMIRLVSRIIAKI